MNINLRNRARTTWLVAAGLVFVAAIPLRAEVGTFDIAGNGSYVQAIIDDPDPVNTGVVWRRHSPAGSRRIVLNEQGEANGDGDPSVLYSTFGRMPVVAWARNSAQGFDVVVSRFAGGVWSEPDVLAGSPADELDPALALDPTDGSVHVVYWINDGSPRVVHRQAPADLSTWSAPVIVSPPGEIAARPSATFHGGALRVVYEAHNMVLGGLPRQIVLATDIGAGFSIEVLATSGNPGPNRPQVHGGPAGLWAEWIDAEVEMSWTREQPGGGWEPLEAEPFSNLEDRDYFVRGRIRAHATD
jgi:hypothetical protein